MLISLKIALRYHIGHEKPHLSRTRPNACCYAFEPGLGQSLCSHTGSITTCSVPQKTTTSDFEEGKWDIQRYFSLRYSVVEKLKAPQASVLEVGDCSGMALDPLVYK